MITIIVSVACAVCAALLGAIGSAIAADGCDDHPGFADMPRGLTR